jgi:hypothetical protein
MTESGDNRSATKRVRSQIRGAFPDVVYPGPITPADGATGEDYDEPQELYRALHGRVWSEIPESFIRVNASGLVLLTDEAFVVYLPESGESGARFDLADDLGPADSRDKKLDDESRGK